MEKREQLYEGKAKKVFATDNPEIVLVSYKDDATAFNGLKKGTIAGKGVIGEECTHCAAGGNCPQRDCRQPQQARWRP